ncbi:MAG TPA: glucosaminidase domain-containing protein [Stellaceae bacterium]
MDAGLAERLASSVDPKSLASLQNRNSDPAVARAVASQFGSFLMQGMMQDGAGTAMAMTDGTGGAAVNSLFASTMSRYAMSGDKLGLADIIYKSMAAKNDPAAAAKAEAATAKAPAAAAPAPGKPVMQGHGAGIALNSYWDNNGHRPLGAPIGRMTVPTGMAAAATALAGAGKTVKPPTALAGAGNHTLSPTVHPAALNPAPAKTIAQTPAAHAPTALAPVASSSPAPSAAPMQWAGISLPAQAHILLPPVATSPSAAATGIVTNQSVAAQPVIAQSADQSIVPNPLPWSQGAAGAAAHPVPHVGGTASDAENFAHTLSPALEQAARKLGVSPRVLLAQAALETGWGHSIVGNNIFGIKAGASWPGATVTARTHEMEGGRLVAHQGAFRAYANVGDAVDDYVSLVSASNRYRSALGAGDNATAYGQALTAGGYATDRNYAAKLAAVADSSRMSYAVASLDEDEPGRLVSAHG